MMEGENPAKKDMPFVGDQLAPGDCYVFMTLHSSPSCP